MTRQNLGRQLKQHDMARAKEIRNGDNTIMSVDQTMRIVRGIGKNLFECETFRSIQASAEGTQTEEKGLVICELSRRLRNTVWLKRGTWVYIEPFDRDMKIYGEIVRPLDDDDYEFLQATGINIKQFLLNSGKESFKQSGDLGEVSVEELSFSEGEDIFVNTNRQKSYREE